VINSSDIALWQRISTTSFRSVFSNSSAVLHCCFISQKCLNYFIRASACLFFPAKVVRSDSTNPPSSSFIFVALAGATFWSLFLATSGKQVKLCYREQERATAVHCRTLVMHRLHP